MKKVHHGCYKRYDLMKKGHIAIEYLQYLLAHYRVYLSKFATTQSYNFTSSWSTLTYLDQRDLLQCSLQASTHT